MKSTISSSSASLSLSLYISNNPFKKPEKQEQTESDVQEWREEFKSLLYRWATNGRTKPLYDFISQLLSEELEKGVIKGRLEALPITKELLSERTFSKEELEWIRILEREAVLYRSEHGLRLVQGRNGLDKAFKEKLSKLLKE